MLETSMFGLISVMLIRFYSDSIQVILYIVYHLTQFDFSIVREKHILPLNIPVYNFVEMKMW